MMERVLKIGKRELGKAEIKEGRERKKGGNWNGLLFLISFLPSSLFNSFPPFLISFLSSLLYFIPFSSISSSFKAFSASLSTFFFSISPLFLSFSLLPFFFTHSSFLLSFFP
jgi:hypothetical protein